MKVEVDIKDTYESLLVTISHNTLNDEVTAVMKKLQSETVEHIVGKFKDEIHLIEPEEIICFYSENQKIKCDTMERTYEIKEKLYALEAQFESKDFIRISKYAIANVKKIHHLEVEFNGSLLVHFNNDKIESISRRQVAKVKNYLGIGGK